MLWRQFESPLILILVFAAGVAAVVQDWTNAIIVLTILLASGMLGFLQEYRASGAVARLRAQVQVRSTVLRDGRAVELPSDRIVPGDVVLLVAGSLVPADGVVLQCRDFFVSQSVLTGESSPVEKRPGCSAADASLPDRFNCVFMGTSVRSGTARVLVVKTGAATLYGEIADELQLRPPETDFERGLRRYGSLLSQIMLALVLVVFAANVFLERPPVDSLLFAMALAIGMSPELLPAIVSIALSQGAREMARHGVIVKRLNAIENLGSMDVLCIDKTGTLTRGVMALDAARDAQGRESAGILRDAFLNALLQTGLPNPLDEAIAERAAVEKFGVSKFSKLDEIPYDFTRKRLSIVVSSPDKKGDALIVTKGAVATVLEVCDRIEWSNKVVTLDAERRAAVEQLFAEWSAQGYRVLGLARKSVPLKAAYGRGDESGLVFSGFLLFLDPPKDNISDVLAAIHHLGVKLKVISGDNRFVAAHLAQTVGMPKPRMLTGSQLNDMSDEALWHLAPRTDLFVEVDPNQKERIILALKKTGHVVGYLGDGINDAPALHAADVGISVDQAVDVAKEAADFVLLEQDLDVLRRGIEQGRATFANTLKYISITTSANFGNMISMAVASLFLPFLPYSPNRSS